jgi:hypothetical protein
LFDLTLVPSPTIGEGDFVNVIPGLTEAIIIESSISCSFLKIGRKVRTPFKLTVIKKLQSCLDYIHYNPVNAGFVERPE